MWRGEKDDATEKEQSNPCNEDEVRHTETKRLIRIVSLTWNKSHKKEDCEGFWHRGMIMTAEQKCSMSQYQV